MTLSSYLAKVCQLFASSMTDDLKALGLKYVKYIENLTTDTQVMILKDADNNLTICFEGTRTRIKQFSKNRAWNFVLSIFTSMDWVNNFNIRHVKSIAGTASEGAVIALDSVHDEILKVIDRQKVLNQIFVTGHSRGGGLATLYYLYLCHSYGNEKISLQSFAAQRVISWKTYRENKKYMGKAKRHYIASDIVVNNPPFIIGFRHYGCKMKHQTDKKDIPGIHDISNYL